MGAKQIIMERETLYEMVWKKPVDELAKEYGLSGRGFAKMCARMQIPVPGRGDWQRMKKGHRLTIPPLPELRNDYHQRVHLMKVDAETEERVCNADVAKRIIFEKAPLNKIIVKRTEPMHPKVKQTEESLRKAHADAEGFIQPTRQNCLDLYISPNSIDRAIVIMDTLIKTLEERKIRCFVKKEQKARTCVYILDEELSFSLVEKAGRRERNLTPSEIKEQINDPWKHNTKKYVYFPTGELSLKINESYNRVRGTWSDGKNHRLEDCLNNFIIGLFKTAIEAKVTRERIKREELERQEAIRQRDERERIRREEAAKFEELEQEVDSWWRSVQIRSYVEAVRAWAIKKYNKVNPDSELGLWLSWAEKQADRLDPLCIEDKMESDDLPF